MTVVASGRKKAPNAITQMTSELGPAAAAVAIHRSPTTAATRNRTTSQNRISRRSAIGRTIHSFAKELDDGRVARRPARPLRPRRAARGGIHAARALLPRPARARARADDHLQPQLAAGRAR